MYTEQRQDQVKGQGQAPQHLAWHETLELHELITFQSNSLMAFKMNVHDVKNSSLKGLYLEAIQTLEQNLTELLPYLQLAPSGARNLTGEDLTAFYAGQLLIFAKTAVRNYAIAITETSTPSLRDIFQNQLLRLIKFHAKVFYFMLERGLYPTYNLDQLLANDKKNAILALNLPLKNNE